MQDVLFLVVYISFMTALTMTTIAIANSLRQTRQNFYISAHGDTFTDRVRDEEEESSPEIQVSDEEAEGEEEKLNDDQDDE